MRWAAAACPTVGQAAGDGLTDRLVVLDHICRVFDIGVRYPEKEVNALLRAFHDDYAALRRHLVEEGFLARENNIYWRTGGSVDL